jgi:alginate O-acetyltransferase complex protein AlgI
MIATWLYTIQIFCDFSGYSDMAIAVAGLIGYKLVINFDAPYLADSIQDFWRRWHISLSTWIRDYIYFSLGGGRMKNRWLVYRNLMITMLAGGMWHGAAWTFVALGGAHGGAGDPCLMWPQVST